MEEKKLTDEEIIKDIERSTGMPSYWKKIVLDLIHRLQAENEELKSPKFASWKIKFFNAQEEIKRLKDENQNIRINCENARNITGQMFDKNAELQEQVDELKGKICELVADKCHLVVKEKQAVKDTVEKFAKRLKEKCKELQDKYSHICKSKYEMVQETCRYEGVTAVKNSIDEIAKEITENK